MLQRKYHGPRKFVFPDDPAVEGGYADYYKASFDFSKLKLRAGQQPTIVHIEPLSARGAMVVGDLDGRVRDWHATTYGMLGVENWSMIGDDGIEKKVPAFDREPFGAIGFRVPDEWMEKVQPPGWFLRGVADAIWRITEPDPT